MMMANNGTDQIMATNLMIKKPNHNISMTQAFESMLVDESLCDISICCCGEVIKAHRVILAASSAYFRQILSGINCQTQYPIIFINDIEMLDLKTMIDFMYRGEMTIPEGQLPALIKCAEVLGVSGLAHLDPQNLPVFQDSQQSDRTSSPTESTGRQTKRGRKRKKLTPKSEPNDAGSDSEAQSRKGPTDEQYDEPEDMEADGLSGDLVTAKEPEDKLAKSKLRSWSQQIAFKANHKENEESLQLSESESHSQSTEEIQSSQEIDGTVSQKKDNWRHSRARRPPQKYNEFTLPKSIHESKGSDGKADSLKASDTDNEDQSTSIRPPTPRLTRGRSRVHSSDDPKAIASELSDASSVAAPNSTDTPDLPMLPTLTAPALTPNTRSRRQTHSPSESPKVLTLVRPKESEAMTPTRDMPVLKQEEDGPQGGPTQGSSSQNRIKTPIKSQTPMSVPASSSYKWRSKNAQTSTTKSTPRPRVSRGADQLLPYEYESIEVDGPPVYKCTVETQDSKSCNQTFRSKQNISDHIRNVHNKSEQRYCCPLCMKMFKWKTSLNNHMNHTHPDSRPAPMRHFSRKSMPELH